MAMLHAGCVVVCIAVGQPGGQTMPSPVIRTGLFGISADYFRCYWAASQRSASSAAIHPDPAAVTACR